jgi:hypothetical protein
VKPILLGGTGLYYTYEVFAHCCPCTRTHKNYGPVIQNSLKKSSSTEPKIWFYYVPNQTMNCVPPQMSCAQRSHAIKSVCMQVSHAKMFVCPITVDDTTPLFKSITFFNCYIDLTIIYIVNQENHILH